MSADPPRGLAERGASPAEEGTGLPADRAQSLADGLDDLPPVLTVGQTAEVMGVKPKTVRTYSTPGEGKLKRARLPDGWHMGIETKSLRALLARQPARRAERPDRSAPGEEEEACVKMVRCPNCKILIPEGGQCKFCRRQKLGIPYWVDRIVDGTVW